MPDFWGDVGGYHPPGTTGSNPLGPIGPQYESSYWDNYFKDQFNGTPVQGAQFNTANSDQDRLEQQRVIQMLQAQAAGDPNSQAQQQLRNAYAGAQSQQSSLGSTMRGQSAGAAMRSIGRGQQDIARSLPGDQQMLQLQEQQAAQAMLAQLLQQQHQQDIGQAHSMAQGSLQGQGVVDNYYRQLMGGAIDSGAAGQQVALGRGLANQGFDLESNNINQGFYRDLINAAATGTASAGSAWGNGHTGGSGYRQVGGQDSIVPEWDK